MNIYLTVVVTFISFIYFIYIFEKFLPANIKEKHSKIIFFDKILSFFNLRDGIRKIFFASIAIVLNLIFLVRFMMGHDYLEKVIKLSSDLLSPREIGIGGVLSCLRTGEILFVVVLSFLKSRIFIDFSKYVLSPLMVLNIAFLPMTVTSIVGAMDDPIAISRTYLMAVELGIMTSLLLYNRYEHFDLKINRSTVKGILVASFFLLVLSINDNLPQALLGKTIFYLPLPNKLNITHRVFVYLAFLLPTIYYILLYPYDYAHRRAFLFFIASAALFAYAAIRKYEVWTSVPSMPLHLCNTAMYIVPLTLIFKTHKVFYFTMFINVIGAFFALLMPNYGSNSLIFQPAVVEFFINHLYAFFMPVLIVLLGIYERPRWRYFGYSMVGFLLYFLLVLFLNVYYTALGSSVDFFFLNSSFIADKLGQWAENLFKINASFTVDGLTLVFHPAYQVAFYLTYVLLALIMRYVYEFLFVALDRSVALYEKNRAYKISFYERKKSQKSEYGGKNMNEEKGHEPSLVIEGLTKRYGSNKKDAVKDFSLRLKGGKIYGFLGKNGAGKSTIIKSIVGMHEFNSGEISVCGYDVERENIEAKSCIGFVPDHYALYENLTGRQYVNYVADLYSVSKDERNARIEEMLDELEMRAQFDRQMKTYSHGMKQKITIMAALVHNPKVRILDEPMTGVDPNSIFEIKEMMRRHAKRGNIVFFSSHLIDVVKNLCDEIIIIKHGQFVLRMTMDEIKECGIDLEKLFIEKASDDDEETKKILEEETK
jgi:ABC-2 type transport system ATP-binding protein